MRNKKHLGESDEMTEINISPLIDMVFILLIFFIVTTVFVEEKGMAANTPDPAPAEDQDEEKIRLSLTIKKNGEVFSKLGPVEKNIGVGGVRALVQQEMQREQYPIMINVEKESLVATYVTVHDTCLIAGAEGITMKVIQTE
jgi:biopolymer transport protein ExbD